MPEGRKVFVFSYCHGPGSGAERVLEHLLAARSAELKIHIAVVAPADSGVYELAAQLGYETVVWPAKGGTTFKEDVPAAIRAWPSLRRHRPRAIHAWHSRCFETTAWFARLLGVPFAGTMHDNPASVVLSRTRRALMRYGAQKMDTLVCVSRATQEAVENAGWNVNTTVIRNGLPDIEPPQTAQHRGPLRVGFLGCSEQWKGLDFVLDLQAALPADAFEWNLYGRITIGSSPRVRELPSQSNIRYHGAADPRLIYSSNDVILHPSVQFDPFPTVLLEAAKHGLPAVASRVGGSAEIVLDGETGFLFDAGDFSGAARALSDLSANPQLRINLCGNARARFVNEFQVDRMLDQYQDFWKSV